ncbi:LuxR C-terminal-related transcriptional regulator [Streptoalloteichus hindustanus]|uniref:AAA ATPase domain-containing protein n=1 Tax=Streptoalloteichus hindustanus TaxID=2017 RepID=A0A1M5ENP0_STRHI|nr:LuxR family transcriptional regulator [Streptoalloteichus hindustanus]SHF80837.1 AAA ATPase domain-containing protein [Streptoalloteichus hindustanus]
MALGEGSAGHKPLAGRLDESRLLAEAGAQARWGAGQFVLVTGPTGVGRSALLSAARRSWLADGLTVRRSQPTVADESTPFVVPRQFLLTDTGRQAPADASDWSPSAAVVELTKAGPVVLCVDDVQHADPGSLGWLAELAALSEALPLLLVCALRTPFDLGNRPLSDLVARSSRTVRLAALGEDEVAEALAGRWDAPTARQLAGPLTRRTGGNPLLVQQVADRLTSHPSGDGGPPDELVHGAVEWWKRRAPAAASAVASALAALATLRAPITTEDVAAVAEVSRSAAARAVDALHGAGLLHSTTPPTFTDPVLRDAVLADLDAASRAELFARATRVLARQCDDAESVAAQLLRGPVTGSTWAVRQLRQAANTAMARGDSTAAVAFLERALAESGGEHTSAVLLAELAVARFDTDSMTALGDFRRGLWHLRRARLHGSPQDQDWAEYDDEAALELQWRWMGSRYTPPSAAAVPRTDRLSGERVLAGIAAAFYLHSHSADVVLELARTALAGGVPTSGPMAVLVSAVAALVCADEHEEADGWLRELLAEARAQGGGFTEALLHVAHASSLHWRGRLAEAERSVRTAFELVPADQWGPAVAIPLRPLVDALLDQGRVDEAWAHASTPLTEDSVSETWACEAYFIARGRVKAARGDLDGALRDITDAGRLGELWDRQNPAANDWRAAAVPVLLAAGQRERAREVAEADLVAARRWGSPRPVGRALWSLAHTGPDERREELLTEAIGLFERAGAQLDVAVATLDLGRWHAEQGRLRPAREMLRTAMDLAARLGATPLAERARAALVAAGGRPRGPRQSGLAGLTRTERLVAERAAAGATNQDIAAELVVSLRAVEMHLTSVYRKLGVPGRSALPDALRTAE